MGGCGGDDAYVQPGGNGATDSGAHLDATTGDATTGDGGTLTDAASDAGDANSADAGDASALAISIPANAPYDTWTWIPVAGAVCADGSMTGMGVNPHQGSTTLTVYFEGGGACWNDETCQGFVGNGGTPLASNLNGYDDAQFADGGAVNGYGLFQRTGNPLASENFVYIPYCTADIHAGSNDATYNNLNDAGTFVIHHQGFTQRRARPRRHQGDLPHDFSPRRHRRERRRLRLVLQLRALPPGVPRRAVVPHRRQRPPAADRRGVHGPGREVAPLRQRPGGLPGLHPGRRRRLLQHVPVPDGTGPQVPWLAAGDGSRRGHQRVLREPHVGCLRAAGPGAGGTTWAASVSAAPRRSSARAPATSPTTCRRSTPSLPRRTSRAADSCARTSPTTCITRPSATRRATQRSRRSSRRSSGSMVASTAAWVDNVPTPF